MDKIIEEIFEKHQVRKGKKQKTAFIDYTLNVAKENGYSAQVEKGMLGARNIVVGNPDSAKVIYTAHYDTCARLPFPNFLTPKNFGIYLLYNLAIVLGFFAIAFAVGLVIGVIVGLLEFEPKILEFVPELVFILLFALMLFGPANKHTANDNTSGVTTLFGIMKNLPEEQREKVAFVFFDLEEMGLFGSSSFAGKHKEVKNQTLLINFDCVSDGKDIMLVSKKGAKQFNGLLAEAYKSNGDVAVDIADKAFYPSDQTNFKKGVGVASFKKTKRGMFYMNRIHTKKDTVYRRENIDFLVEGSLKLADMV